MTEHFLFGQKIVTVLPLHVSFPSVASILEVYLGHGAWDAANLTFQDRPMIFASDDFPSDFCGWVVLAMSSLTKRGGPGDLSQWVQINIVRSYLVDLARQGWQTAAPVERDFMCIALCEGCDNLGGDM